MNTSIHNKHHTEGQHPTTDEINEKKNDIHPASPGCRPGTYPQIDEEEEAEEELQKQTSIALTSDHRITCTCIYCCCNL